MEDLDDERTVFDGEHWDLLSGVKWRCRVEGVRRGGFWKGRRASHAASNDKDGWELWESREALWKSDCVWANSSSAIW